MKSTSFASEKILIFGIYGSGKSHSWLTILQMAQDNKEDIKFYVIGTEVGAVARMKDKYLEAFEERVEYRDCLNWLDMAEWTEEILAKIRPQDFIIIEGVDKPWDYVQALWDKLHGTPLSYDPKDPFAMEKGLPTDEDRRDWPRINGVYYKWINSILEADCHCVAVGPQDNLRLPNPQKAKAWHDDAEVVGLFSQFGVRPSGQKKLGHGFHTVLWARNPRKDVWTISTVDDHTRERLDNFEMHNFVLEYLVKVAGWEI